MKLLIKLNEHLRVYFAVLDLIKDAFGLFKVAGKVFVYLEDQLDFRTQQGLIFLVKLRDGRRRKHIWSF